MPSYLKDVVPIMPLTDEEILRHESATHCFICEESSPSPLDSSPNSQNMRKVRDHDHILELLDDDFVHLSYKPEEAISCLLHLDANNLYGSAMSQYLPHSNFKWLSTEEKVNFDITQWCSNPTSDVGYILEVDILYAQELHDLHDELQFCPENIVPPIEGKRQVKLIPNLFNKNKYVLHYRNLYQAVTHGLKIDKIHRILSFNQSNWLQPYIDLNTGKRQAAKNTFGNDLYKLFVNAIFGKCMEAVDKHLNIKLVSRWKNYKRSRSAESLTASPHFQSLYF
ncbi:hypothetical protein NQ315_011630 [Exocentrus adspersus]|uniref:DNA-directed DNA polymerase n=1 Tax=Exocentrus adspersus TaxID=1586481 RepID=A0AAV8V8V0_9CUCU|nr:hypothetical protein NQ315_011630 [Exocentrus adspersus]